MPVDAVPSVALVLVSILVPGSGLCLVSNIVRSRGWLTFAAASLGCGFVAVASISLLLALLGLLTLPALVIAWVLLSGMTWFVAIRSHAFRKHVEAWRRDVAADRWTTIAAAATIVAFAAVRWTYPPIANMGATAMRYWADALEIADRGGIPASTLQWGTLLRPATSKSALNTFNGSMALLSGRDPLPAMAILLFVVSVALLIVVMALFTELGIGRLAPVGAMFLLANHALGSELTADLTRNLAENWGRLSAFTAVLLAVVALVRATDGAGGDADGIASETRGIVLTGWVLGVTAGIHLVAAAVAALFVGSYMLARIVTEGSRVRTLARTVAVGAIALVVAGLALLLPPGDLGFRGASGDSAYQALRDDLGLDPSFDPTRFIVTGEVGPPTEDEDVTVSDVAEQFAYRVAGRNVQVVTTDGVLPRWALIVPSLVVVLTAVIVVALGPRDLRVTALGAMVFAGLMLVVGIAFALRYDLFALERFGNRRLFNYAMVPCVIVVLGGGEAALRWAATRGRTPARVGSIVAFAATLVTGAALLSSAGWPKQEKLASLTQQVALLDWIGSHVPCEGRILMDRRTLGTFQTMTGHAAVLEGMGPHVRPEVLVRAIGELLAADTYFRAPRDRRAFLDERGVAAVVATRPFAEFAGWQRVTKLPPDPFRDVPYLTKAFENPVGAVYLVDRPAASRSLPRVSGRPGFRCVAPEAAT